MSFVQRLLHETREKDVTTHIDIFAQVETFAWYTEIAETEFNNLAFLSWFVASDTPLLLNLEASRSINVSLETTRKIVETGLVAYLAFDAWQICDAIREFVPGAVEFIRWRIWWGLGFCVVDDQWIQFDHLAV